MTDNFCVVRVVVFFVFWLLPKKINCSVWPFRWKSEMENNRILDYKIKTFIKDTLYESATLGFIFVVQCTFGTEN